MLILLVLLLFWPFRALKFIEDKMKATAIWVTRQVMGRREVERGQSSAMSVKSGTYFVLFCPFGIKKEAESMLQTRRKRKSGGKKNQVSSMIRSLMKKKLTSQ